MYSSYLFSSTFVFLPKQYIIGFNIFSLLFEIPIVAIFLKICALTAYEHNKHIPPSADV
jgi:Sec-independent protein secretion pathway component TatC